MHSLADIQVTLRIAQINKRLAFVKNNETIAPSLPNGR